MAQHQYEHEKGNNNNDDDDDDDDDNKVVSDAASSSSFFLHYEYYRRRRRQFVRHIISSSQNNSSFNLFGIGAAGGTTNDLIRMLPDGDDKRSTTTRRSSNSCSSSRTRRKQQQHFRLILSTLLMFIYSSSQLLLWMLNINGNNNTHSLSSSSPSFVVFQPCAAWDDTYKPSQFYSRHTVPGQPPFTETRILDYLFKELHYDNRTRPPGYYGNATQGGPVVVRVNILLRSISKIDDVRMEYTTTITFREEWHDERLAFDDGGVLNYLTLPEPQRVWKPDLFFYPEKQGHFHEITTPNLLFRIYPDGRVLYSIRLSMVMACPMRLQFYPMDTQNCTIDMASYAYTINDIDFRWRPNDPVQILSNFHLPRFKLRSVDTGECGTVTTTGAYSCLKLDLIFERQLNYFVFQVYIPTGMLVVVSWVSFWLDQDAIPARITLGVTTLLTVITSTHGINANLPPVAYTKAIDVWTGGCTFFVFAALLEFAVVNYASRREFRKTSHKMMSAAAAAAAAAAYSFSHHMSPAAAAAAGGMPPPLPLSNNLHASLAAQNSSFGGSGNSGGGEQQQQPKYGSMYRRAGNHHQSGGTRRSSKTNNNNNLAFANQPQQQQQQQTSLTGSESNNALFNRHFNNKPMQQQQQLERAFPDLQQQNNNEFGNNNLFGVDLSWNSAAALGNSFIQQPQQNAMLLLRDSCKCEMLLDYTGAAEQNQQQALSNQLSFRQRGTGNAVVNHVGSNSTAAAAGIPTLGTLDVNSAATALMLMNEAVLQQQQHSVNVPVPEPASSKKKKDLRKKSSVAPRSMMDHKRHAGRTRFFFQYFFWPETQAKQIDFVSRFAFPCAFIVFQIGYWGVYLSAIDNTYFWERWFL